MRPTIGAASASLLLLFSSFFGLPSCSSDDPAGAAPAPDGGAPDVAAPGQDASGDAADGAAKTPGTPRRGSRLAPRFRETADGYSQFSAIVDTKLADATCQAINAADGVLRCLPSDAPDGSGTLFADAACTQHLAAQPAACAAKPAFALGLVDGTTGCGARFAVHEIGAAHAGAVYEDQGGTCVAVTADPAKTYYLVGAERPAADFVKLTSGTEAIAGGVGVSVVDGEDGSHFPQGMLIDVARKSGCTRLVAADAKDRCVPLGSATVASFTDSACTKPAALVTETCDPLLAPSTAQGADPSNDGRVHVYELGAKRATNETYNGEPGSCIGPAVVGQDVYDVGAEIPAASFPELVETKGGGTRIEAKLLTAGGVVLPRSYGTTDTQLGGACAVMRAGDGKLRCLPETQVRVFSDDQCTVPIVVTSTAAAPAHVLAPDASCPRRFPVLSVGAEITPAPATMYTNFGGPCVSSAIQPTQHVFAAGPEVAPSTFVEMLEVVR